MNFAVIERDYIRRLILPNFDWVVNPSPSQINPLPKPVAQCRVAMVTTCGVHTQGDPAFNLMSKTGDHSYREIPNDVAWDHLRLSHVGYNTRKVSEDINCVFPLQRLRELEAEGVVGSLNHRHFSFMGYIPITAPLLERTGPEVAQKLQEDGVDLVLLVPA
jgi:Glycine/sarcosine/betaine reductase selenoprotein B (GRDB).